MNRALITRTSTDSASKTSASKTRASKARAPMTRSCLASALTALVFALAASATASAEEPELRTVRICDTSACYIAWNVVDSDGDGVSDADEAAAGTDPFDAESQLPLPIIVEMIGVQMLPTFEFGVGRVTVKPAELQAELEARGGGESPLPAFPLGERKDGLSRLGLDTDLLAEHGYDAEFDGLTLVQGRDENDAPVRRVGGVDMRLISADDNSGPLVMPEGLKIEHMDYNKAEDRTVILYTDGSSLVIEKGKADYRGPDGMPHKGGYYNPDADTGGGEPTEEDIAAWERVRNTTVLVVQGWSPIETDPGQIEDPNRTIILIDPDYMKLEGEAFSPPDIDRAQPETRPDLPDPLQAGGGCWPKCGT